MIRGTIRTTALVVGLAAVAGCGDGSATSDASAPVVATTSIWADITSAALCDLDVPALIPAGADAHTYEPSLRDRERLETAELVIANGAGLEGRFVDLLDTVAAGDTNVVEITPWVDVLEAAPGGHDHDDDTHDDGDDTHDGDSHDDGDDTHDGDSHDDGDDTHDEDTHSDGDSHDEGEGADDGHGHDGEGADDGHGHDLEVDPHLWHDPRRVASALDVIASAASALELDECVDEFRSALTALDGEIVELLGVVPDADRVLVTSHDSLRYFGDRYGFEIVGTVIPSANTLAETNAADLDELADTIEEYGVPVIFTDAFASTGDADALADRLGVAVVPLVTDALTDDASTDTYLEMMRSNAERIAEALAP